MTRRHSDLDPLEGALASLPLHEPARKRSDRIRARSYQELQRLPLRERLIRSKHSVSWPRVVESVVISAAAVLYLAEVLRLAVYLSGL